MMNTAFLKLSTIGSCENKEYCDRDVRKEIFFSSSDSPKEVSDHVRRIQLKYHRGNGPAEDEVFLTSVEPVFVKLDESDIIYAFLDEKNTSTNGHKETRYGGDGFSPNQKAYLAELHLLRIGYTMMVPKEVQVDVFGALEGCPTSAKQNSSCYPTRPICGYDKEYGQYDLRHDFNKRLLGYSIPKEDDEKSISKLSASSALEDQKQIWERYLLTFATVKEAQSNDPSITDYELSLDLGHFCKFARHIEDLKSR